MLDGAFGWPPEIFELWAGPAWVICTTAGTPCRCTAAASFVSPGMKRSSSSRTWGIWLAPHGNSQMLSSIVMSPGPYLASPSYQAMIRSPQDPSGSAYRNHCPDLTMRFFSVSGPSFIGWKSEGYVLAIMSPPYIAASMSCAMLMRWASLVPS